MPRGQATMRLALKEAGAEPDESWCIGVEKEFPDLVLEIALTSGGINKLDVYRRFNGPELWFWRRNRLEIFALNPGGTYEASRARPRVPSARFSRSEGVRHRPRVKAFLRLACRNRPPSPSREGNEHPGGAAVDHDPQFAKTL